MTLIPRLCPLVNRIELPRKGLWKLSIAESLDGIILHVSSKAMSFLHHLPTEQILFHANSQQMELPPKYCFVSNVDCSVGIADLTLYAN